MAITPQQVSLVVTASNLAALVPLYMIIDKIMSAPGDYAGHWCVELALVFTLMMASIMMHASETKHGLRGIEFGQFSLVRESQAFLWLDRVVALLVVAYILAGWLWLGLYYPSPLFWLVGGVGLVCMTISEHWARTPQQFMMSHGTWHILAFTALAILFS
jgi:hypothetical protein